MANTLATPTWVMKGVARGFTNSVKFVQGTNRSYDDQYVIDGAKVGQTVKARLPQRFVVSDGQAYQPQNLLDQTVNITLTNQKQVAFGWSSQQETTDLDDVRERYVVPGGQAIANAADLLAFEAVYRDVYNSVGTPGTTPSATITYLQGGVKLDDGAVQQDGRNAVLDPLAMATIANTSSTLFNPSATISENYRDGMFGRNQLGFAEWYKDQNRPVHVTGTFTASTPIVNGASQTGSSLVTSGWASGASSLKKGDIFTIAGVNMVNPLSYVSTGRLQQFAVTADISDTTGAMTIGITPSIITSGALQTVDASPANGAAITVWAATPAGGTLSTTSSPVGMLYTKDAFAFVMADLVKPSGGAQTTFFRSKDWGIMIRHVEQYLIGTDQNASRLDILIGAATVQARFACRVQG